MDMADHRRDPDRRGRFAVWPERPARRGNLSLDGDHRASLDAISAMFVMPYYPVWSLLCIILAVMVVYGLVPATGASA